MFFVLYYCFQVFDINGEIFKLRGSWRKKLTANLRIYFGKGGGCFCPPPTPFPLVAPWLALASFPPLEQNPKASRLLHSPPIILPTHLQRPLDRICAVHAAQLYLLLLQLPGSGAFKIFHSMIFQRMLDTFHLFHDQGEECVWYNIAVHGDSCFYRKYHIWVIWWPLLTNQQKLRRG